jgi:cytochrome c oxidase cbb3-type subunit III
MKDLRIVLGVVATTLLLMCVALFLTACKREQRQFQPPPSNFKAQQIEQSDLRPGGAPALINISNPVEENAYEVSEGKRLFTQYNCAGCHANGGGGMGPALMDEKWIYGSAPANIYATILEGRPNGMPAFRAKIPDHQVWQLVGYVRSLSGQVPKSVSPNRNDDMNAHKSEQTSEKKKPVNSVQPKSAEQP